MTEQNKYEFASSNTNRTTFAFGALFVRKLVSLKDEQKCFCHRISIAMIDAIEHVFNVANSYLSCRRPSLSLRRSKLARTRKSMKKKPFRSLPVRTGFHREGIGPINESV
jgi:hypothetical protein